MDDFDLLYDLLAQRIRAYPRVIKGDAACGEHGALRALHGMMQQVIAARPERPWVCTFPGCNLTELHGHPQSQSQSASEPK